MREDTPMLGKYKPRLLRAYRSSQGGVLLRLVIGGIKREPVEDAELTRDQALRLIADIANAMMVP